MTLRPPLLTLPPLIAERFALAGRQFILRISDVQQFEDYGPDHDVIQLEVLLEGKPLALYDLNPGLSAEECFRLWGLLCAGLQAAVRAYYVAPPDSPPIEPHLGCWGMRPDLAPLRRDDGGIGLTIGVAVDTTNLERRGDARLYAQLLRQAVRAVLREWVIAAGLVPRARTAPPN